MKSIKPGRGPSLMGGIMGVALIFFGLLWMVVAIQIGFGFMALFGLVFVGIAIAQTVYNFKNATGENRYSAFDIVDSQEEDDPLNQRFGKASLPSRSKVSEKAAAVCPYCGERAGADFVFCKRCGKKLV